MKIKITASEGARLDVGRRVAKGVTIEAPKDLTQQQALHLLAFGYAEPVEGE